MSTLKQAIAAAHSSLEGRRYYEAEARIREVLRSQPSNAAALCLLAAIHSDRGDDTEAVRLFQASISFQPEFLAPYAALADAYYALGRMAESARLYSAWRLVEPDNPLVQHMATAVIGEGGRSRCSEDYVRSHFNGFAIAFDEVLVERLAYRGPEIVAAALSKWLSTPSSDSEILDAGCGTGLCGPHLRALAHSLLGVDLSENMIAEAERRGCYDELVVSELCSFMARQHDRFQAIVSADVLIYFGALEEFAQTVHRALKPAGLFVATIEVLNDEQPVPYELRNSGRFAHRETYVDQILAEAGFEIIDAQRACLRYEIGSPVAFYVFVARKV